jgi:hypothetical protein
VLKLHPETIDKRSDVTEKSGGSYEELPEASQDALAIAVKPERLGVRTSRASRAVIMRLFNFRSSGCLNILSLPSAKLDWTLVQIDMMT